MRFPETSAWLLALLSGALQVLIFPSPSLYFLSWVALVPLLYVLLRSFRDRSLSLMDSSGKPVGQMNGRQAFFLGWIAWLVWSFGSCFWLIYTMDHYGGLGGPVSFLVFILFSMTLALFSGAFSWLLVRIAARWGLRLALLLAPFLWTTVEFFHCRVVGFFWDPLGTSQVDNIPLARIASYTGVYGVSFAIVLVNCAFVSALLAPRERRRSMLIVAILTAVVLQLGIFIKPRPSRADRTAVLVQQNVPIEENEQWTYDSYQKLLNELVELSVKSGGTSTGSPGLIVWPESPAPFFTDEPYFREEMSQLSQQSHSYIIAGTITQLPRTARDQKPQIYNSAVLIGPGGQMSDRYDKIHLVPFGEYVPFKPILFFADKLTKEVGDFVPGNRRNLFYLDGAPVGTFICYEAIFPDEVRQFAAEGAQVFVNISNDEWFGYVSSPGQHLNMARMRAIENHRWILRDTNTGITASIDPWGRVVAQAPRDRRTAIDVPYGLETELTFYTRHGDWFAWLCGIISLAALLLRFRLRPAVTRS